MRKTRDIQAEIRALEAEKRALKAERKSGLAGQGEMVVVTQKDDEVVEVRRDRRGKMMLVR